MKTLFRTVMSSTALLASTGVCAAPPGPIYQRLPDIAAPDGAWDFASWDAAHNRVIVAHANDVLLVDPANPASVRAIGQIDGAHAALAIPGGDRVLVSSAHDNTVRILDGSSGSQMASIAVASDPDATVLSKDGRFAYVMGADSGAISVIDLDRQTEASRIVVKPGLEVAVLFGDHMLAVNDEDLGEIDRALAAAKRVSKSGADAKIARRISKGRPGSRGIWPRPLDERCKATAAIRNWRRKCGIDAVMYV